MKKLSRLVRTGKWGTSIRAKLVPLLDKEKEAGKLVNDLLEEHYKKKGLL